MCIVKKCIYLLGHLAKICGRIGSCWVTILVIYWLGIEHFLGGDIAGDLIFLYFLESVFWK